LADCWLAMGRNKQVVTLLSAIAAKKPDDLAITYLLGTAMIRDNQVEKGQQVIDRILRNGDSAEARLLLGTTKLNARDFPGALVDLAKAAALNPDLPDVHAYYGLTLNATGDPERAIKEFRTALEVNPYDFTANLELGILLKDEENI